MRAMCPVITAATDPMNGSMVQPRIPATMEMSAIVLLAGAGAA